jgi:hypothetical protein
MSGKKPCVGNELYGKDPVVGILNSCKSSEALRKFLIDFGSVMYPAVANVAWVKEASTWELLGLFLGAVHDIYYNDLDKLVLERNSFEDRRVQQYNPMLTAGENLKDDDSRDEEECAARDRVREELGVDLVSFKGRYNGANVLGPVMVLYRGLHEKTVFEPEAKLGVTSLIKDAKNPEARKAAEMRQELLLQGVIRQELLRLNALLDVGAISKVDGEKCGSGFLDKVSYNWKRRNVP